ncbi:hypothetical protein C8R47DRAFT_1069259 [Mycena vitilis]|nr:hypothetical protein C8R47DRAFT_1069259 [Mycena vitilis]
MAELEAEFLVIQVCFVLFFLYFEHHRDARNQHDDLRRKLYTLCLDAGVAFERGTAVKLVKSDGLMLVTVQDGKNLEGDITLQQNELVPRLLILFLRIDHFSTLSAGTTERKNEMVVGADGHNSLVRSLVMDSPENIATVAGVNISISTVTQLMQKHEELRSIRRENEITLWMGTGSNITGMLNVTLLFELNLFSLLTTPLGSTAPLDALGGDMYRNEDLSHLNRLALSAYDSRLRKLVELSHSCRFTLQTIFKQKNLMGLDGSIVLVGDAAHPVLIHGSHNSSMAVEDAVTLGALFSHLTDRKQIPILTETYEELPVRKRRTNETRVSEYRSLVKTSLPPGNLQVLERDVALQLTKDPAFDDFNSWEGSKLAKTWEQYLILFDHDACEEVENWWSKWSRMPVWRKEEER